MSNCPCTAEFESLPTEMVYGDSAHWLIKFCDCNGDPLDTAGWQIYLILRDGMTDESTTFKRTITYTIPASTDSAAGKATISINSLDSKDIPVGKYYYEFKRVIPDSTPPDVWTFAYSERLEFEVKPGTSILT